ncbi:hypothetical protein L291_3447 [Acinetobacter guillouiae MSP4-18]|nr:hypothetical protein L291_3447 [Acinetobacter guillouiae MSP4-18]
MIMLTQMFNHLATGQGFFMPDCQIRRVLWKLLAIHGCI